MIVDALKDKYSLPDLLKMLDFPKSSYYYQQAAMRRKDKHKEIRGKIKKLFYENRECYGYRRIHSLLKRDGVPLTILLVKGCSDALRRIKESLGYMSPREYRQSLGLVA